MKQIDEFYLDNGLKVIMKDLLGLQVLLILFQVFFMQIVLVFFNALELITLETIIVL